MALNNRMPRDGNSFASFPINYHGSLSVCVFVYISLFEFLVLSKEPKIKLPCDDTTINPKTTTFKTTDNTENVCSSSEYICWVCGKHQEKHR